MSSIESSSPGTRLRSYLRRIDPAVATAFGCIVVLLLVGSLYSANFLSPAYLLQQLKVASFLGVIATGMFLVILLGQIDLSVPWVVSVGGMMAASATAYGVYGEILAIPFGILCGLALGLLNGIGIAYLRIPSMIITLAVNSVAQGLMVAYSGGFSPRARKDRVTITHTDGGGTSRAVVPPGTPISPGDTVLVGERWF